MALEVLQNFGMEKARVAEVLDIHSAVAPTLVAILRRTEHKIIQLIGGKIFYRRQVSLEQNSQI